MYDGYFPVITLTFYLLQSLLINVSVRERSSLINGRIKINSNWNARVKQRHTPPTSMTLISCFVLLGLELH